MPDGAGLSPEKKTRWISSSEEFILIKKKEKRRKLSNNFHTSRQNTGAKVLYKETFLQLLLMSGFLINVVIVNIVGKYCSSYIN